MLVLHTHICMESCCDDNETHSNTYSSLSFSYRTPYWKMKFMIPIEIQNEKMRKLMVMTMMIRIGDCNYNLSNWAIVFSRTDWNDSIENSWSLDASSPQSHISDQIKWHKIRTYCSTWDVIIIWKCVEKFFYAMKCVALIHVTSSF